jgi:hypothetical protein
MGFKCLGMHENTHSTAFFLLAVPLPLKWKVGPPRRYLDFFSRRSHALRLLAELLTEAGPNDDPQPVEERFGAHSMRGVCAGMGFE